MTYTHGDWYVKAGRGEEFVAAWTELAEWTVGEVDGAQWGKLLRNREDPSHFVSFGPWRDDAAVDAWRASDGFQQRIGAIREMVDRFEPYTLDEVASAG